MGDQVVITAISTIGVILGGGGLAAALSVFRPGNKDAPITKNEAESVEVHASQQLVMMTLRDVMDELKGTREENERILEENATIKEEQAKYVRVIESLRYGFSQMSDYIRDIHTRWEYLRGFDEPPPPPQVAGLEPDPTEKNAP